MKLVTKISVCAAALLAAGSVYASPRATEASGANYLVAAEDLDSFHMGAYYRYSSREISHGRDSISRDSIGFVAGYDILPWASVYGVLGMGDAQLDRGDDGRHGFSPLYGVGFWANILDHDLFSGLACESKVRITASGQYTYGKPEINGRETKISDLHAALTVGVVNEITGNKRLRPEAVGVFLGPVWDSVKCDDYNPTGDEMGVVFGLDVYLSRYTGFSVSYEVYGSEDNAIGLSVNCRF